MHSTDVTFRINMGLHDESLLGMDEARQNFEELERHVGDILPTLDDVDDLDDAEHIKGITLKTLEIGTFGEYNIQFTVTIQHDVSISLLQPTTMQDITDVIYEHGANSPITFEEVPNYFLYPYESSRSSSECVSYL